MMRQQKITALVIVDENHSLIGIVSAYDLIKSMGSIKTIEEIMLAPETFFLTQQLLKMQSLRWRMPHSESSQLLMSLEK